MSNLDVPRIVALSTALCLVGCSSGGGGAPPPPPADAGPCGRTCFGVCDRSTGSCVDCLDDGHCLSAREPYCGSRDGYSGLCVECARDEHCADETPTCDARTATCVECVDGSDCPATAALCEDSQCVSCTRDSECEAHAPANARCYRGQCAACSSPADCGGDFACAYGTCSTTERIGELPACLPCESSEDCADGLACVRALHAPELGAFCLPVGLSDAECENHRPYSVYTNEWFAQHPTTGGVSRAAHVCSFNEYTSCSAIRDMLARKPCMTGDDCGLPGYSDGLCIDGICAYSSYGFSGYDCPPGVDYQGSRPNAYCRMPD